MLLVGQTYEFLSFKGRLNALDGTKNSSIHTSKIHPENQVLLQNNNKDLSVKDFFREQISETRKVYKQSEKLLESTVLKRRVL